MLEYDNSAFYYFAITLIVIYLIPGTWYVVKELCLALLGGGEVGAQARTKDEQAKAANIKNATTGLARLKSSSFMTNLACVVVAWSVFLYLLSLVHGDGEVNTFDPYQILGIEQGQLSGEIKKAYRKLSLKYHPDKNPGDKSAEEMFMKIAKAYEALTDETAKENYEKYGNPDGKQSLEVSIGLPSILLENPKVVLVLYLIGMVVVIPSVVGLWYSNSKQFGEKNIMYDTYSAFYALLQEPYRTKNIPEVIAASAECRAINSTKKGKKEIENQAANDEAMMALYVRMKNDKLMVKPKIEHAQILKGNLLLHAHVMRLTDMLTPDLMKDLNAMLGRCSELVEGVIEISHQRKWLDTSVAAIRFSQCMVQSLWSNNSPFEQLPHMTAEEAKVITKGPKPQASSLAEYLNIPDSEKKGLSGFSAAEKASILQVCALLPRIKVETKLFVEEEEKDFDEDAAKDAAVPDSAIEEVVSKGVVKAEGPKGDDIYEQDLVTLRITLTRENLSSNDPKVKGKQSKKAGPVYAPLFPKTVYENWWLVLTDRSSNEALRAAQTEVNIHAFEKVSSQGREVTHEIRFMAPPKTGSYEMELMVLSDCYLGLDQVLPIRFDVRPASELPEYSPHPEDVELDNEPTLFEQVMNANVEDSSDDDDDDEDAKEKDKEKGKKTEAAKSDASKKAPIGRNGKGVVVQDVEDDSEDED